MKNTKRRKTHVEKVADAQQRQYAKVQPAHQALLLGPVDGLVVGVLGQRLGVQLRVGVVDGVDNGPLDVAIDLDMLGVGVKRLVDTGSGGLAIVSGAQHVDVAGGRERVRGVLRWCNPREE